MSFEPEGLHQLVLWRLAVSEDGGAFLKDIESTSITPGKRQPLVRDGLIVEEKRKLPRTGRSALYLLLTDKGWTWCQNNLDREIKSRSLLSTPILRRLLIVLKTYFENQGSVVSFGQLIQQARPRKAISVIRTDPPLDLEEAIARACLDLADGRDNVRVRLADLRDRLRGVPKDTLDQKLLEMEQQGKLSLYRLDNPQDIFAEDRAAVLHTATGNERHIVYFGGKGS
jgi:hypothetical protein